MAKLAAGSAGEGLRGRVAGLVYRETAQGTVVQAAPSARRATSAKEILEPEAVRRWAAYAALSKGLDPEAGTNGYLAFSALGRSIMRIDPALPIPAEPPAGRFLGTWYKFWSRAIRPLTPAPLPRRGRGEGPTAPTRRGS